MRPSASRVASRRFLIDIVMMFFDVLCRDFPRTRRAFIDAIPPAIHAVTSGALDVMAWRINLALHNPILVGKVVGRVLSAANPNGPFHEIITKVIKGDRINRDDVDAFVDVLEKSTIEVLNDITDVQSAAAALQMPVEQAVRITLSPKRNAARSTVHRALGN